MIDVLKNNYEIVIKNNFVMIKRYSNIINISENNICLYINNRKVNISGNNMVVCSLDEYEIVIKGSIISIEYTNE